MNAIIFSSVDTAVITLPLVVCNVFIEGWPTNKGAVAADLLTVYAVREHRR
jgi:hypothetical protein